MALHETPRFTTQCKTLAKRYPTLQVDLRRGLDDPATHWLTIPAARGFQKARIRVGKTGKRGGLRVVRAIHREHVVLLGILAKNDRGDFTKAEYDRMLDDALAVFVELGVELRGRRR